MASMTKHIPVCKNTTGNCGQDAEEESPVSEGETETVGKPTGKAPDTQNVQDITETVTEESGGRDSTKHMGASPVMPVNGEM